ncbi:hypothetical protein FI667_g7366, partial [Globisporangium splendens]
MRELKKHQQESPLNGPQPQQEHEGEQPDVAVTQSLPYVKCRESVSAVFGFDRHAKASSRRVSTASNATTETAGSSPENDHHLPTSLSYSVPSTTMVTNTPRGRPAVDVIATYMNTCDSRTIKSDLLRAHAHFCSPRGAFVNAVVCVPSNGPSSSSRLRTSSMRSNKESSADWGWFADIDSSGESWGGDGSTYSLRRKLSADLGLIDLGGSLDVLGDEQTNTRITAAHKTFTINADGYPKVVSASIAIPKFRIVQSRAGADRHAQYLITLKLGKELYADWRRYSEFGELAKTLASDRYPRTLEAWKSIDTRWFNRLEPSYLHQKCITLENFLRELMYESSEPAIVIDFLGGYMGKVNSRPSDPVAYRPGAQLPKELRPPQPKHERELFEKMWAENFKRSRVNYDGSSIEESRTA